ncbi:MAG: ATP-binding protein [Actinobacteria bacterium]|nr:ATP-binding protein [Actinomycetota bacterium]
MPATPSGGYDQSLAIPGRSRLPLCPSGLPRRPRPALALRVLPGTAESVSLARQLVQELLSDRHPVIDTALLLMSELVTNSVTHSRSRLPGGTVTVVVSDGSDGVLIQVRDDGGMAQPRLPRLPAVPTTDPGATDGEHGYGLLLVSALARTWGTVTTSEGRVTWCRVTTGQQS